MKKFILVFSAIIVMASVSNAQRFGTTPARDNTGRVETFTHTAKTYSSSITVEPNASKAYVKVASLTGTMTVVVTVTSAQLDDELIMEFVGDTAAGGHVVTFSTGTSCNTATLTVGTSKKTAVRFVYDGAAYVREGE